MKSFELIYKELEDLFINKLPDFIEKVNVKHNDGIILKPFENTKLEENCLNLPSFKFGFEQAEYEEKDRIIENIIYTINLEIKLSPNTEQNSINFYRYFEALEVLFNESESFHKYKILNIIKNKIEIRIIK